MTHFASLCRNCKQENPFLVTLATPVRFSFGSQRWCYCAAMVEGRSAMLKGISAVMAAVGLALLSVSAQADHRYNNRGDRELAYLVGGVLVGAAVGGLIYADRYGYGYPRYVQRVGRYYGPPRRHYVGYPPGHRHYQRAPRHHRHYRRW
jgi:hypothetical protein